MAASEPANSKGSKRTAVLVIVLSIVLGEKNECCTHTELRRLRRGDSRSSITRHRWNTRATLSQPRAFDRSFEHAHKRARTTSLLPSHPARRSASWARGRGVSATNNPRLPPLSPGFPTFFPTFRHTLSMSRSCALIMNAHLSSLPPPFLVLSFPPHIPFLLPRRISQR